VLRSLFFPQRHSYLYMRLASSIECTPAMSNEGIMRVSFEIRLYNEGPATASDLTILSKKIDGMTYGMNPQWHQLTTVAGQQLVCGVPIHPGVMAQVANASIDLPFVPRAAQQLRRDPDVSF